MPYPFKNPTLNVFHIKAGLATTPQHAHIHKVLRDQDIAPTTVSLN